LDQRVLERLAGCRVEALRRRAKYLLIDVEQGQTLVIHLGMTGQFTLAPAGTPVDRHEHLAFHFASGRRLRLVDPRRFGLAFALPTAGLEEDRHFAHLGVEPLESSFTAHHLQACSKGRRGPLKTFLMDGRVVVGVGNIYASEALWRAKVHPNRSVARISITTWGRVTEAVRTILGNAIAEGGTTLNDFLDGEGNTGYFQVSLAAYGRHGEPCNRCGRGIRRMVHAGRSTFYCPGCQR
jgi:formamidopyrimidine-DNA glycosylase